VAEVTYDKKLTALPVFHSYNDFISEIERSAEQKLEHDSSTNNLILRYRSLMQTTR
jgi:hypothetical protein